MDITAALLQNMCRTCSKQQLTFHSIFNYAENKLKIYEVLATVAPQVFFVKTDQLPSQICESCLNKLTVAYDFQQMCIESEKQWRSMLCGDTNTMLASTAPLAITQEQDPLHVKIKSEECVIVQNEAEEEARNLELQLLSEDQPTEIAESYQDDHASETESVNSESTTTDEDTDDSESEMNVETISPRRKSQSGESSKAETVTRRNSLSGDSNEVKPMTPTANIPNETGEEEAKKPKKSCENTQILPCPHCNKLFDRRFNLMRHLKIHYNEERPFQCELCKYRFTTTKLLEGHKLLHEVGFLDSGSAKPITPNGKLFRCDGCPKKFLSLAELTEHVKTHPEDVKRKFKCLECGRYFRENATLIDHMNKHNGQKRFACDICSKAYFDKKSLKDHQRLHTGEKPFLCAKCGKSFTTKTSLNHHQVRHSEKKTYQCSECPRKFVCQADQIKHTATHRALKPYACDICGSKYTRSTTLTKHKMVHTGERPYKCKECDMTPVLKVHMRTHTGEKPYKCKFCERAFSASGDLNKHLRTHVGEKTYMCDQCPEAFKYQVELREHQSQHFKQQQASTDLMDMTKSEKSST